MSADENTSVDLEHVLWRTRGRHWDYSFVLSPVIPLVDSWYDLHVEVFAAISADTLPVTVGGTLISGSDTKFFVATAFQDAALRDIAGRPIANYIVWFPNPDQSEPPTLKLPSSWGQQVVSALADARERTFDASPQDAVDGVFAEARDLSKELVLEGEGVLIDFGTKVVLEKKKPRTPQRGSLIWRPVLWAPIVIILLLAVIWYHTR